MATSTLERMNDQHFFTEDAIPFRMAPENSESNRGPTISTTEAAAIAVALMQLVPDDTAEANPWYEARQFTSLRPR